jgi:hypothetical protein
MAIQMAESLIQISSKYGHGKDKLTGRIVKIENFTGRFDIYNDSNEHIGQVNIHQRPTDSKVIYFDKVSNPLYIGEVDENVGGVGTGIWLSSIVLSSWIVQNRNVFHDKKVLELGCGVGMCGLTVLIETCARCVKFTDCDGSLFDCLKQNIEQNSTKMRIAPSVQMFDWNQSVKNGDVSYDTVQGGYDIILASDCLYHNTKDILLDAIFCNLNVNGNLFMANPPEWNRPGFDEFIYALKQYGVVCMERCKLTMNKQYTKEIWMLIFTRLE